MDGASQGRLLGLTCKPLLPFPRIDPGGRLVQLSSRRLPSCPVGTSIDGRERRAGICIYPAEPSLLCLAWTGLDSRLG